MSVDMQRHYQSILGKNPTADLSLLQLPCLIKIEKTIESHFVVDLCVDIHVAGKKNMPQNGEKSTRKGAGIN